MQITIANVVALDDTSVPMTIMTGWEQAFVTTAFLPYIETTPPAQRHQQQRAAVLIADLCLRIGDVISAGQTVVV